MIIRLCLAYWLLHGHALCSITASHFGTELIDDSITQGLIIHDWYWERCLGQTELQMGMHK